jgi:mannan endo-1,4-beta-mannosidase
MTHGSARAKRGPRRIMGMAIAVIAVIAIAAGITLYNRSSDPPAPLPVHLPPTPQSYLGVYSNTFPSSYAKLTTFASETGSKPDMIMYYSGWYQSFPVGFADTAAKNGVVPLVQIDPQTVSVAAIAAGRYDAYLSSYAESVRAYRDPVILSFGHEMNGSWYPWGYGKTSPKVFVAAWRHIVTLFRALGAKNVTWMWTINVINDTQTGRIPKPTPWWPGPKYVTWVGIDGYYLKPSWQFAPLFGPTIAAVRLLTGDPILIGETGAVPSVGQPAKIDDLFAGIHKYGLLGFVWFDSTTHAPTGQAEPFGVSGSAAFAAFRKGAATFVRPGS